MPAGKLHVVVQLIVRVPAQDDVAEPEAFVQNGQKLVAAQVLPAQDAIRVENADLDVLDALLSHERARGADLVA